MTFGSEPNSIVSMLIREVGRSWFSIQIVDSLTRDISKITDAILRVYEGAQDVDVSEVTEETGDSERKKRENICTYFCIYAS